MIPSMSECSSAATPAMAAICGAEPIEILAWSSAENNWFGVEMRGPLEHASRLGRLQ